MTRSYKWKKSIVQRLRDVHAILPQNGMTMATHTGTGVPKTNSETPDTAQQIVNRQQQTRRNNRVKVTMPRMPWEPSR